MKTPCVKALSIRVRMLLAVWLPVLLIASLLTAVFLSARMDDMDEAYHLKSQALIRQLAVSSEYGLFSANAAQLQVLAVAALQESDVISVAILDSRGSTLFAAGQNRYTQRPALGSTPSATFDATSAVDLLAQPVLASSVQLDDLLESTPPRAALKPIVLGYVLVEFSQAKLLARGREVLLLGGVVLLLGLLLASFLALKLGQGVMEPISRVCVSIQQIGQGNFSVHNPVLADDPLRDLQTVLNQTAKRLALSRDDLQQRILVATNALREKVAEAENATLSKSRFLAAASHDLRQPTHALGMFVARLAQLPHDPQTTGLIKNVEDSVLVMQDLLDGLLDISRLEANAVPVCWSTFPIEAIFERLRGTFALVAQEKDLYLQVRTSVAWVTSDAALLQRVLINLVSNALKYTTTGGVVVACREVTGGFVGELAGGQKIRLEVWDSGQGIAPEHHQAIFTEFFQIGNQERNRTQGLGLGLSIVQRALRLLGHPLALCSRLGQGSRFSFELPRAAPVLALPSPPEVVVPAREFEGRRVLLIEDDVLVLAALESLLASWGCASRGAAGGRAALVCLERGWVPDLIISDYQLPQGACGIEVVAQLRAQLGLAVPACLMSGDMNPSLIQAAKAAHLTLLHKPVRPAKLRSLVRHLLWSA